MESLRIASLNMNGGRDKNKRAALAESNVNKNIDMFFLQETHGSDDNEAEWGRNFKGQIFF